MPVHQIESVYVHEDGLVVQVLSGQAGRTLVEKLVLFKQQFRIKRRKGSCRKRTHMLAGFPTLAVSELATFP